MLLVVAGAWAQKLGPKEFNAAVAGKSSIQLVDVRTPGEYGKGHIKGAKNIDFRRGFDQGISKLKKDQPVYVYCLSGGRSAAAASKMKSQGFTSVVDLAGGMIAWNNAGMPVANGGGKASVGTSRSSYDGMIRSNVPVLVDFYAPWCAPCKKMTPMLKELTSNYRGQFKLIKLNADDEKALMKELGVREIPTLLIYKGGKKVWSHVGLVGEDVLKKELGVN